MLKEQPWILFAPEMLLEWKQARDEGRDVDFLRTKCEEVVSRSKTDNVEELAKLLKIQLDSAPMVQDYPFFEPSDYPAIQAELHDRRHLFSVPKDDDRLRDKLAGAWSGRISGCLLGKPIEGWKSRDLQRLLMEIGNFPMKRYIEWKDFTPSWKAKCTMKSAWADCINGIAPIDDDTNYTVLALELIKKYGKNFTSDDVLEGWLSRLPYLATCTAERVAYRNASNGLKSPETATVFNPYREWIGAQIRGDFFGYINMGNPRLAAEMAYRDACISHVKNGIYGEMLMAAMIAAAAVTCDLIKIVEAGIDEIPIRSRLHRDIDAVLGWYRIGRSYDEVIVEIHKQYDESDSHGWCHTNSNAMLVATALLYGEKDFGKSLCMAVQPGFDTDCNGATVGSILGIMIGQKAIPKIWLEPYNGKLATSIIGYNFVTIDELVAATIELINE
jgi:ADP-ribosylglycohydrolase